MLLLLLLIGPALWRAKLVAPEPTLLLLDRHGTFLGEVGEGDAEGAAFGYWPIEAGALPERVVAATLAVEDRRFYEHGGIDLRAVARAVQQNWSAGERVSGASTLAMQVARMQRPGRRSYSRKAVEALTASFLTARYGRDAVLRHYLRIVPYGNRIRGIRYAARRYLDKPVEDLSWAEVAFLTAIPQSPARMNPFHPQGKARAVARGARILDLLRGEGKLSEADYTLAQEQIRRLRIPPKGRRPESVLHAVLHLEDALRPHRTAGEVDPRVHTTLDLPLQEELSWRLLRAVEAWEGWGAGNAALAVIDRQGWEVRAWVGSSGFFDQRRAGAIDYGRVPRSPGSTLKPFLYALALDRGLITPATILDDLHRGPGSIGNADERFLGPLLPRMALGNSRNVPAVHLLGKLGLDHSYSFLGDLGLHEHQRPARHYGYGLALGSLPVTLEQLATAYTALVGEGRLEPLRWVREEEPQVGKGERGRRLISEDTARLISLFLSDPQARLPSFPRMGFTEYPFPVAAKTGTSSQYRDAWTVAWSERYLVVAWVGHPDYLPMTRLSGYRSAAQLVQGVMTTLHGDQLDGLRDVSFPPPRGFAAHRLCALSGRRATEVCDRVVLEWLRPTEVPPDVCRSHLRLAVDRRDGRRATAATPTAAVAVRTFVDLPPHYAPWAAAAGLPRPPSVSTGGIRPAVSGLRHPQGVHLVITSPELQARLLRDPEAPPGRSTLALRAVVDPPVEQVVWYVDGRPFRVVPYPYTARWPLSPGEHSFQLRLPFRQEASTPVTVLVQ